MAYVKTIIVNCNADGTFASATSQKAGVMVETDDGTVEEPQPNEPIDFAEMKLLVSKIKE